MHIYTYIYIYIYIYSHTKQQTILSRELSGQPSKGFGKVSVSLERACGFYFVRRAQILATVHSSTIIMIIVPIP